MSWKRVALVALFFAVCPASSQGNVPGLVQMISNYAKVAVNADKPARNLSTPSTPPPENLTDPTPEYEDFDDIQEEDRSLKQDSANNMMKYFNGLVSLLALMYKFNGSFGGIKPQNLHFKNQNEPRDTRRNKETGKRFQEAEDRFEFPQKKFKYGGSAAENMIDQQFQPVENYPPYNPLKANSAETYEQEDKKTSYDSDLMQYDLTKNSQSDSNVDIQQSYSYDIPYESSNTYDSSMTWNNQDIHPVYQPWMSKTPSEDKPTSNGDTYLPWNTKTPEDKPSTNGDSYQPWKNKMPIVDSKPTGGGSQPRQPWAGKPTPDDFPVYHHDFSSHSPSAPDHHFEYHEVDHPMDEDRVSKKPYSYYFLGRKLWYVPLMFSVYFIIYIGALVLKSVARHKIQFPDKLWNLHEDHFGHGKHRRHRKVDDITETYEKAVETVKNKFM